jgi:Sulfotransferase domain
MMRPGSTLQYNIASELIERIGVGRREAWVDDHSVYFAACNNQKGLVAFKSHILTAEIRSLIGEGRAKVLTCFRDVRDVVASWQAKAGQKQSIGEALSLTGNAIAQFSEWEMIDPAIRLLSRYEDFAFDIGGEARRVADFLGLEMDNSIALSLSSALSVVSLQQRLASLPEDGLTRRGGFAWDSKTLVHTNHLNGGIAGRAKEELSRDLYCAITDLHADWLVAHGYSL